MCNPMEGLRRGWQSDRLELLSDRQERRRQRNLKTLDTSPGWNP
jgi:hypothetical protein